MNKTLLSIDSPVDFEYDPYSDEALRNPTELYRELRRRYPAYPLPQYDAWALSRFDDVWLVGEDAERFTMDIGPVFEPAALERSNGGVAPEPAEFTSTSSFSQLDPPLQTKLRQGLGAPLRPRAVSRLEEYMRELARERLDVLVPRGEFDLYTEYGGVVSAGVMCRVVGLPREHAPRLLELVNEGLRRKPPGIADDTAQYQIEMHQLLVARVNARRAEYPDGEPSPAIDGLLRTEVGGRPLTDDEIAVQLFAIVSGGTETVPKVVARCLLELSRRPEQLAAVRADPPVNCAAAFEEAMRFGAPLQYVGRTAKQDVEIAGAHIRAGQRVFLLIPAANRDEREFAHPDEFIWNRPIERHFAFGHGLHFCIGVHVARLEGRVLLEELLARIPSFHLDESRALMPPSDFQIGYVRLPLVIT
ncbi:cytochrome P450 [Conexibacter stalactiti]|uniref:Cytochrome P450 n=1 Tax=Conexibacter stalactiti TaxID=1940611 RepID=A0ABU4HLX7_9ACTN|nr:cytochrome P450 [Conexibacter stalactiti]MDW5593044.1 cytochrome P450 [Conexibacter stalactiti]MEC5033685.1 cytochrome P450 [Conexibacter stalactiti]